MKYTLVSGKRVFKYNSFSKATDRLVKLGTGRLYFGRILVGEL